MTTFVPPQWAAKPSHSVALVADDGSLPLLDAATLIGRDPALASIALPDDPLVSRRHAALVHHETGRLYVIDLASREGVAVDGQRIPPNKPSEVRSGSRITIGTRSWTVQFQDTQVRASHLLVKHAGSRRPSSWREAKVTRSESEALAMITRFREELVSGRADFAQLASQESHCSSAQRGGDLGWFGRKQMQKAFEDATYALQVGELSPPVHSDSGVHLILRTG